MEILDELRALQRDLDELDDSVAAVLLEQDERCSNDRSLRRLVQQPPLVHPLLAVYGLVPTGYARVAGSGVCSVSLTPQQVPSSR